MCIKAVCVWLCDMPIKKPSMLIQYTNMRIGVAEKEHQKTTFLSIDSQSLQSLRFTL